MKYPMNIDANLVPLFDEMWASESHDWHVTPIRRIPTFEGLFVYLIYTFFL